MKRDALNHPKMLDLASRLDVTRAQAIGVVTLLFDFTAQYAPQGDIGKHRDGAISRACEWTGSPEEFITALVESGWVDKSENHRLRVHDWHEHCEQWVKLKLQKLNLDFLAEYRGQLPQGTAKSGGVSTAEPIAEPTAEAITEPTAEGGASRDQAKPSLAKPSPNPNQAKPILEEGESNAADAAGPLAHQEVLSAWNQAMQQYCKLTSKRRAALSQRLKDRFWLEHWRRAIARASESDFCRGVNDRGWVADFEWFLRPDSVTKLLEGKYANRSKPQRETFADMRVAGTKRAIEEFVGDA
jgi:hypothetical protein